MTPAQDHKRAYDGDEGPNTGGMGVYTPVPIVTDDEYATMMDVLERTVAAMRDEGIHYQGVLYGGFILTDDGPKVLEFNARFGDPETQVMLPRLETDLVDIMLATAEERLADVELCLEGRLGGLRRHGIGRLPRRLREGPAIAGIDEAERVDGVTVFHAGTALQRWRVRHHRRPRAQRHRLGRDVRRGPRSRVRGGRSILGRRVLPHRHRCEGRPGRDAWKA